ncbi:DNA mismatch repair endonuclease MutL [Megasphaera sp. SW808]|uniref:DNA mismatch repair endonuclease MutL n=1 Tax=Megasphaera sp. SW808 TaxID=2530045 RepID=UPI00143AAF6D|nr:DNA mismatch repair endonuclease MutL [Megasphaera sp. SW808]NJE34711.1 DNA mismatch repair endonuclease MutL [Megasphaera sp. SW808]
MSSIINLLDEATRNKIAAGEVVERPASCVKELVENAIDAGASAIEVEIADGGQSYMRVTDDGCGMSPEDARKCIIRHATSKISAVEDIFAISSLGFRGEAVPSIAAVSHMQITTRRPDDDFATHLLLDGGEITSEDQIGAPVGTTMEVSDLFYNTPARRKFLKSERTESSKISEMITKLALSHPSIAFTFTNNGRTTLHTGGGGDLKETIANIYGAALAKEIFSISHDDGDIAVEGYVGKPSVLKSTRAWQTCIVNGRIVHNPLIFKAVENAYHAMLPKSGYPFAMIHIHMDPAAVDVNVHPAKTEIKFADEQAVYRAVYHSIITALIAQEKPEDIATNIDMPPQQIQRREAEEELLELKEQTAAPPAQAQELPFEDLSPLPQRRADAVQEPRRMPVWETRDAVTPVYSRQDETSAQRPFHAYEPSRSSADEWESFSRELASKGQAAQDDAPIITFDGDEDVFIPLGEVADCFIIAKKGQDLYIIDQHAAHERIRYDKFCRRAEKMPSQQLLTAEFVEVDGDDMTLLLERPDVFADLGYTYSEAGPSTLRVEEVPCDLPTSQIADSLEDICRALHENAAVDKATLRHRSLAYLSCHGAIKAGDALNIRQMKQLLEDLFHTDKPYVCPHGRPIIVRFTPDELAKLFKRT